MIKNIITKRKIIPNLSLTVSSVSITFIVLVGLVIWANPMQPDTYYVPRYSLHKDQHLKQGCVDCHQPYSKITVGTCYECHQDYRPENRFTPAQIYPAGWIKNWKEDIQEQRQRIKQAHLKYHSLQSIAGQDCSNCHFEHQPISERLEYTHSADSFLNMDVNMYGCMNCHGIEQAPRDDAHRIYYVDLQTKTDCWKCHFSDESWELKVSSKIGEDK